MNFTFIKITRHNTNIISPLIIPVLSLSLSLSSLSLPSSLAFSPSLSSLSLSLSVSLSLSILFYLPIAPPSHRIPYIFFLLCISSSRLLFSCIYLHSFHCLLIIEILAIHLFFIILFSSSFFLSPPLSLSLSFCLLILLSLFLSLSFLCPSRSRSLSPVSLVLCLKTLKIYDISFFPSFLSLSLPFILLLLIPLMYIFHDMLYRFIYFLFMTLAFNFYVYLFMISIVYFKHY